MDRSPEQDFSLVGSLEVSWADGWSSRHQNENLKSSFDRKGLSVRCQPRSDNRFETSSCSISLLPEMMNDMIGISAPRLHSVVGLNDRSTQWRGVGNYL
jgi:hypothetical protein